MITEIMWPLGLIDSATSIRRWKEIYAHDDPGCNTPPRTQAIMWQTIGTLRLLPNNTMLTFSSTTGPTIKFDMISSAGKPIRDDKRWLAWAKLRNMPSQKSIHGYPSRVRCRVC